MAVTRDFLLEDTPMTMQIALQAKDGFVLVSDLKNRINNKVSSLTYSTKIYHDEVHGVLIALAGYTANPDSEPGQTLIEHLRKCTSVDQRIIIDWLRKYAEKAKRSHDEDNISILVVHPSAQYGKILTVKINNYRVDSTEHRWIAINGNQSNPAVFWPEYFKCRGGHTLGEATNIAAITILAGEELNPYGVGGLEIFQYDSKWRCLSEEETASIASKYKSLKTYLNKLISADGLTS
jgi:hypothetical protein